MVISIVIVIVASALSGIGGVTLNQYMNRKKTGAEIEKIRLDTEKLRIELDSLLPSVNEIIIYDSGSTKSSPLGHDFKDYGGRPYANGAHYGNKGTAEISYVGENGKIINVCRTNNDGKYHLRLKSYHNSSAGHREVLLRNAATPGMRRIRVSCEVRVIGSPHILHFGWRLATDESRLSDEKVPVDSKSWTPVDKYFEIDPNKECFLRIDDYGRH
jgi:hypothetical protein